MPSGSIVHCRSVTSSTAKVEVPLAVHQNAATRFHLGLGLNSSTIDNYFGFGSLLHIDSLFGDTGEDSSSVEFGILSRDFDAKRDASRPSADSKSSRRHAYPLLDLTVWLALPRD